MDYNVILGEKLGIGRLMVIEIEHLTVATPVSAEVEQDVFVVMACGALGGINVLGRVGHFRIETLVNMESGLSQGRR